MTQGQSIAHPIIGGAVTIKECGLNTKLPLMTILIAGTDATNEEPARPPQSITLDHRQVSALHLALCTYYAKTP